MEKTGMNGVIVSGSRLERTYKNLHLRRALISLHELTQDHAESPNSANQPTPGREGGRSNNGGTTFETLDPNVVIILVVLLFALICAAFLNSIMRCVMRRSNRAANAPEESQTVQGLDAKGLAVLPILPFRGAQFEKLKDGSPIECPICLSEFAENEKVRLLPKCNHVFHIECIDMWLLSHVSCPVCRDSIIEPKHPSSAIAAVEEQPDSSDNSMVGQNNMRAELLRESGSSYTGSSGGGGESSSALVVHSSSLGGNGSSSSANQDVAAGSRRRGWGSLSPLFAVDNVMILFAGNPGTSFRGLGHAASSSSSTSTS